MRLLDADLWRKLEASAPSGESLAVRPAAPGLTERVLAGIDSQHRHHWLIPIDGTQASLEDHLTRGISATTRLLTLKGSDKTYIDVVCHDAAGVDAFDLIGNSIVERLADAANEPAHEISQVLALWRRFWGEVPQEALSVEATLGLLGELTFLIEWLIPAIGADAVLHWRGPFGARHDFEWRQHSVEVKTTASTRGHIHTIHGIEQLDSPENGTLNVYALAVRIEAGGTLTLPASVDRVRAALLADPRSLTIYEQALIRVGYSPLHAEVYEQTRVRVVDQAIYQVRDDFPRLTRHRIDKTTLRGIEELSYEINLNGYEHLVSSRTPPYRDAPSR